MPPKFHKTKEFLELNKKWQEKLKKSGFEDIEDGKEELLVSSAIFKKKKFLKTYKIKEEYYYMATHFLNEYRFDSNIDRVVWTYHVEAISARDISKLLKKLKLGNIEKSSVSTIIVKLRRAMYLECKGYTT